jgi:hypothetical protein
MDPITTSRLRPPLAVELASGEVRLACEVIRLRNGWFVWCEYAGQIDMHHTQYTTHKLQNESTCDGLA